MNHTDLNHCFTAGSRHFIITAMPPIVQQPREGPLDMSTTILSSRHFHIPPNYVVECFSCSSKAARGEDLQVEHPVCCGYAPAFHFHPTLPGMLGATLIGPPGMSRSHGSAL